MRIQATLLSLLLLPALACGGGADTPSFEDPLTALEAAETAQSNGDSATAAAGFRYAADNGEGKLKYQGLMGLGQALASSEPAAAAEAFARAQSECADHYDIQGAQKMIDAWIRAGNLDEGNKLLAAASGQFPDQKASLVKQEQALEALASGDAESLADLGYVGD